MRRADEGPQTQVTLMKGFWPGKTMVTIGQWKYVTGCSEKQAELIVSLVKLNGRVWIVPDGDKAGERHAQSSSASFRRIASCGG